MGIPGISWGAWGGAVLAAALWAVPGALAQPPKGESKAKLHLISERTALIPGETNWLGVQYDIEPQWHIYWNGQNDTGAPPSVTPKLPDGFSAGELVWPAPVRHVAEGGLLDHIYEKRIVLLLPVKVPADAKPQSKVTLSIDSDWMICRETCMLGSGSASITLPVAAAGATPDKSGDAKLFDATRDRIPKPAPADGSIVTTTWKDGTLSVTSHKGKKLVFYPMTDSAKPDNLLKGGSSDKGHLDLKFEKPARVLGIVEITPESGGVRPIVCLIDVPAPGANKTGDGTSNPGKTP